jgi:F420-dependent oxidoreductase-like protein
MKFAVHVPYFTWPDAPASIAPTLRRIAATVEDIGCSRLTVMDHFFQMEAYFERPDLDMLEGYTTLGFLAAATERIGLGLLVTGVTYRHPGLLAKIVTTLDVLSGGRAFLGIGAAWYEREHKGLGVPFPGQIGRYQRLEETLQIVRQMWSGDRGPFQGKHFQLAETINVPQSIQRPRPPILIGGSGEKRTLPLVAKYADACNLFGRMPIEDLQRKIDVIRRECEAIGRDPAEVELTVLGGDWPAPEDHEAFLEQARAYHAIGITEIFMMPVGPDPVGLIESIAPVVTELANLG